MRYLRFGVPSRQAELSKHGVPHRALGPTPAFPTSPCHYWKSRGVLEKLVFTVFRAASETISVPSYCSRGCGPITQRTVDSLQADEASSLLFSHPFHHAVVINDPTPNRRHKWSYALLLYTAVGMWGRGAWAVLVRCLVRLRIRLSISVHSPHPLPRPFLGQPRNDSKDQE